MTDAESSAARRYKEILAEVTEAAGALRERDRRRAEELGEALLGLEDEMQRCGERARLSATVTQLHWERALDLLWQESWMKLRPHPAPDQEADLTRLDAYEAELHRRSDALRDVVRRRWYNIGRR